MMRIAPFKDHVYAWLGFRKAKADRLRNRPVWARSDFMASESAIRLSWADRVRALVSGKVHVQFVHWMDRKPLRWESDCDIAVLPPNVPVD